MMDTTGSFPGLILTFVCVLITWDASVDGKSMCLKFNRFGTLDCAPDKRIEVDEVKYYSNRGCRGYLGRVTSCDGSAFSTSVTSLETACNHRMTCTFRGRRCEIFEESEDYVAGYAKIWYSCEDKPTTTAVATLSEMTTTEQESTTSAPVYDTTTQANQGTDTPNSNLTQSGGATDVAQVGRNSPDTGAVIGGVIGGLIALLITVLILVIIGRRKIRGYKENLSDNNEKRASLTASCENDLYDVPDNNISHPPVVKANGTQNAVNLDLTRASNGAPLYSLEKAESPSDTDAPVYSNSYSEVDPSSPTNNTDTKLASNNVITPKTPTAPTDGVDSNEYAEPNTPPPRQYKTNMDKKAKAKLPSNNVITPKIPTALTDGVDSPEYAEPNTPPPRQYKTNMDKMPKAIPPKIKTKPNRTALQTDAKKPSINSPAASYYSMATIVEPPEYSLSKPVPFEHAGGSNYLVFERDQGSEEHKETGTESNGYTDVPRQDHYGYSHLDDFDVEGGRPSNYDEVFLGDTFEDNHGYANVATC